MKGILLEDPISEGSTTGVSDTTILPKSTDPQASSTPSLQVKDHRRPKTSSNRSSDRVKEGFHAFAWLNAYNESYSASPDPPTVSESYISPAVENKKLDEDLKEIDDFLGHKTNLNDRLTYKDCPSRNRTELYRLLSKERKEVTAGNDTNQTQRKRYETKVDILNAAESLFQFFLPSNYQGPTVQKYWGALYRLLEACVSECVSLFVLISI